MHVNFDVSLHKNHLFERNYLHISHILNQIDSQIKTQKTLTEIFLLSFFR